MHALLLRGRFRWEHVRNDIVVAKGWFWNGITEVGRTQILEQYFRNGSTASNWYMGLIADDSFSALAAGDTMSSHTGWTEDTNYDEATRPEWAPDAASDQKVDNSTSVTFTMSSDQTLKGMFLTTDNTKGGTTGTLWCTGLFDSDVVIPSAEILRCFYDCTAKEG